MSAAPPVAVAARSDPPWSGTSGSGQTGQASVELVALLPAVLVVALAAAQVLAAGAAREAAGQAAAAGAAAMLQDRDPREEARAAAGVPARRLRIEIDGRRVDVRVTPRAVLPGLAERLSSRASADAGPVVAR